MQLTTDPDQMAELTARLALWRIKGIGPHLFRQLLLHYGSAQRLLTRDALPLTGLSMALVAALKNPDWLGAERDLLWLAEPSHYVLWDKSIAPVDTVLIPDALATIPQAPPLLFVSGEPTCLTRAQIAMVGSRKATAYGMSIGYEFASQLAALNSVITSGLALGIDSHCQRAALAVGGVSIGVLAVGLDRVYPACHQALAEQMIGTGGALVSEFPLGTPPLAHYFPRRNRLISGLSVAVIVVEAALKSGSLITAHCAAEQGREVFVVPGSIRHVNFQGCHKLIQEGAHLLTSIADIHEVLPDLLDLTPLALTAAPRLNRPALNAAERSVLKVLEDTPLGLNEIYFRLALPIESVSSLLTSLVLKGYLKQDSFGFCLNPG